MWRSSSRCAWRAPSRTAKALGMRNGSKPCRLRPVGRTCGVRSRSPPGAGRTKRPSSARRRPASSRSCEQQAVGRARVPRSAASCSGVPCRPSAAAGVAPCDQGLDRSAVRQRRRGRLGHREQQVGALGGRRRRADHVQAVRDQRVFEFEHGGGDTLHDRASQRRRPRRARRVARSSVRGLRLDQRGEVARARRWRPGRAPRQRSSEALRSSRPR